MENKLTEGGNEKYDGILTELHKSKLDQFCRDEVMFEAVKRVLLFPIYNAGTLGTTEKTQARRNFVFNIYAAYSGTKDNEKLGESVARACEGINLLESAWDELERFKILKVESKKENPAI